MKDQPNWFPKVHRMPSEWVQPDTFPDLSDYDEIAIDLETRDPGIKDTGPCRISGRAVYGAAAGSIRLGLFGSLFDHEISRRTLPGYDYLGHRLSILHLYFAPAPGRRKVSRVQIERNL